VSAPAKWLAWVLAARPKTLTISIAPVLAGTSLAWVEGGKFAALPMLAALLAAILIQAGTNLHNDAADYEKGGDRPDRAGPRRAVAHGWLSAKEVHRAAFLAFTLAGILGLYLAMVGGWPIILVGLLSLLCGYGYSGGPRPISYTPLGELFVLLFFGLVAVGGSYWLQLHALSQGALLIGAAIGAFASAVLMVNNYRDLEADQAVGRKTLAVVLGRPTSRLVYAGLLLAPFPLAMLVGKEFWPIWLALPLAVILLRAFWRSAPGAAFNRILAGTAMLQLLYALLFVLGGWR
jgi:1,4-dihydroxy-2-naphthoate octaprenyltransferase